MKSTAHLAKFVLRPGQWDENAEAWSRLIPTDSPGNLSAILQAKVAAGNAKVCRIERNGERVGFIVFTATDRHELLVHAAFSNSRESVLADCFDEIDVLARACECDTIRFHTMRHGLITAAQRDGFRVSEVIMRRDVKHV